MAIQNLKFSIITAATYVQFNGDLHPLNTLRIQRINGDMIDITDTSGNLLYQSLGYTNSTVDTAEYTKTDDFVAALAAKLFK